MSVTRPSFEDWHCTEAGSPKGSHTSGALICRLESNNDEGSDLKKKEPEEKTPEEVTEEGQEAGHFHQPLAVSCIEFLAKVGFPCRLNAICRGNQLLNLDTVHTRWLVVTGSSGNSAATVLNMACTAGWSDVSA